MLIRVARCTTESRGVEPGQSGQGLVEVDQVGVLAGVRRVGAGLVVERGDELAAAAFGPPLLTGVVDEDASHGLGADREEVVAILPVDVALAREFHVSLVHQSGWVERVVAAFLLHVGGGEAAQLIVEQRQKPLGRIGVALADAMKHLCWMLAHE